MRNEATGGGAVWRTASRLRRCESGAAIAMVVLMGFAMVMISAMVIARAMSQYNLGQADREFEESILAAESGIDTALVALDADPLYATVASGTDLSSKAHVVAAAEGLAAQSGNLVSTPAGDYVVVMASGSSTVYVVGANPGWSDPNRKLRVIEAQFEDAQTSAANCWPEGAIIAKGLIETGDAQVMTIPSSAHSANVIGNFDFKGSSGVYIDGDIRVAGTVLNTPPEGSYGAQESGSTALDFPSAGAIATWETELIVAAQAGGTISGLDIDTPTVINAPVYVDGDIEMHSGATLTINGPGTVYVNGFVELGGDSEMYNGSLLAVKEFFKQGGGTTYLLNGSATDAGLVSFYIDKGAIEFGGAAIGTQGVIYAARGGIALTGSAALQGAAIAGGEVPDGQIKFGGGTTMSYPAGLVPSVTWLPDVSGGPYDGCPAIFPDLPGGAIVANGDVKLSGGAYTSSPTGGHASVNTNGDYADSTSTVNGDINAVGSITVGTVTGTATSGIDPFEFAPQSVIDSWENDLIEAAKLGGTLPSQSYGDDVTVNTPVFIDGDFTMSGETLTLSGGGVFYVDGKLTISGGGTVINDGVIATSGLLKFSGGGFYFVAGDPSQSIIVSFAQNSKALELSGGSSSEAQGVAYAPNGGILLSGGSDWLGSLVATGRVGLGKVELSGGSNLSYPSDLINSNVHLPTSGSPPAATGAISVSFMREMSG